MRDAQRVDIEGFEGIAIGTARLRAVFVPALNMLGASLLHDGEELLHLRGGLAPYADAGKTRGIPFLHPWANRLSSDGYSFDGVAVRVGATGGRIGRDALGQPIHGLLGGRHAWTVTHADACRLTASFDFRDPRLLADFPFPHVLAMRVTAEDDTLRIETVLDASGPRPVPVSFGFHPYFRLPGVAREKWRVSLPVRERLLLDERCIPTGAREMVGAARATQADSSSAALVPAALAPLGARTFDDLFTGIDAGEPFVMEGGGRRIEVRFEAGFPFAQVWAPEGSDFLCIEPMTAPIDALRADGADLPAVAPGDALRTAWSVRVLGA